MLESSIFISQINFKIKEKNQLKSSLKHSLRNFYRFNVDEQKKENINLISSELKQEFQKNKSSDTSTKIMNYLEEMKKNYEIKTNTTKEIFKSNDNIRDLKKTASRRLENKNMNMTLETLEEQLEEIETEEEE